MQMPLSQSHVFVSHCYKINSKKTSQKHSSYPNVSHDDMGKIMSPLNGIEFRSFISPSFIVVVFSFGLLLLNLLRALRRVLLFPRD